MKDIAKILSEMQMNLKVPKGNYNSFGKYKYRSCEDIVEAVKQIMPKGYALMLSDEMVMLGTRYYIKAQALLAGEAGQVITYGYARESEDKKGMDDSQITGTASSYARKYALNGLFAIDDTKDADTNEHKKEVIEGGLLDDEARNESKGAFLREIHERLDKVVNSAQLATALTKEQTEYLAKKLVKIDPIAYNAFKKRYSELTAQFKKMDEEELMQQFNNA